ncbi:MAG: LysR family transcriptional regulator [Lachnospiraceae bacterium]|nr:LysR family transcriptional regulator [Lachnospiraceae bacterium]
MDFRALNTFIQIAEVGSFTRAAEKLGYAQPTVSLQIKQLESELGVQLFDRIGHTVSLTEGGREALSYAQRICHLSQEMVQGANKQYELGGVIRLAMADSLCTPLIIKEFARFRRLYPKISLKVTTAGTDELFRLLDHNEVDLVCTLDNHIYNTTYIISNEEKIGVHFVSSASNPLCEQGTVDIHDLMTQPFLLTEKGMSYRRLLDEYLARHSMEIEPVLEIGSADSICKLVEEDMGISFLPDYVTEASVKAGRLVRLPVKDMDVELWKQLLYHRDKWVSLQMEALIRHLSGILLG